MKKILFILFSSVILFSCGDDFDDKTNRNLQTTCDDSNTEFQNIYNNTLQSSNSYEAISVDLEVHEISISVSTAKNICKIGYQSQHSDDTVPYTIEVFDNTNSQLVYSGSHLFTQNTTSYITPNYPITLQPNTSYSIKRIQSNVILDLSDVLGRYIYTYDNTNPALIVNILPVTFGDLTIESSSFYDVGNTNPDHYLHTLPYIDVVFEN